MRAQKQIPALPRLSRYMNRLVGRAATGITTLPRNYKLDKDTTQRLLDLAVEDNLVKLHKKVMREDGGADGAAAIGDAADEVIFVMNQLMLIVLKMM